MRPPFFSVCLPTYNRAGLVGAALESVLAQSDPDFEVLVADNASTDATAEVLKRFDDPRVRIIRNERTVTMYANHNLCTRQAAAPWVVFLHSDDRLEPGALSSLRRRIESRDCDVVYPAKAFHRDYVKEGDLLLFGIHAVPSLLRWPAGTPSGAAYRTELLRKMPFVEAGVVSDFILLGDILLGGGTIVISSEPTVAIGEGAFQYSSNWHRSGRFITDVSKVFKTLISASDVLDDVGQQIDEWSDSEIAFLLMMLSHADERAAIDRLERTLGARDSYRKDSKYRHVTLYKVVGWRNLRVLFAAAKLFRSMQARIGPSK